MATYKYDENGNRVQLMKYERLGAKTLTSIFPEAKETAAMIIRKPEVRGRLADKYKVRSSSRLVRLIFYKFIKLMLLRVAEGDVFMFPGRTGAYIALKPIKDEFVKKARQNGKMQEIDLIKSNFKVPLFVYDFGPYNHKRDAVVHVPKYLYRKALRNAEEGKIPWTTFRKQLKHDNNTRGYT